MDDNYERTISFKRRIFLNETNINGLFMRACSSGDIHFVKYIYDNKHTHKSFDIHYCKKNAFNPKSKTR